MQPLRVVVLIVVILVGAGSLGLSGGYACYLRSDGYRRACSSSLTASLGLPAEIGRVTPRSRRSREFNDVVVYLPERRGIALKTSRAIVTHIPTPGASDDYELELIDGESEISTRTWLREDYRHLLESGLRPGFDPNGPRSVSFRGFRLSFERDTFRMALNDAAGIVRFDHETEGTAHITCTDLNGYHSDTPVVLKARLSPLGGGAQVDSLQLLVPRLPLSILRLESLVGVALRSGTFQGKLDYAESADDRRLSVSGEIFDLKLADVSAPFVPRPWSGELPEVELEELATSRGKFEAVRFRGAVRDLQLGDVFAPWGFEAVGGRLQLSVSSADLRPLSIAKLVITGKCEDVSLEALGRALGWGEMTGTASITISDLTIENNHLKSLRAEIRVAPTDGKPNWIDRRLISEIMKRAVGVSLPPILPERIEYTQLGVRFEVQDELLHLQGTHGDRDRVLLTVKVGGSEVPLVQEALLPRQIDLRPALDDLRERAMKYVSERLRDISPDQALRSISSRATSQPAKPEP